MRSTRPRVIAAASVLPLLVLATGCGGSSKKADAAASSPAPSASAPATPSSAAPVPSASQSPTVAGLKQLTATQLKAAVLTAKELPGGVWNLQPDDNTPNPAVADKVCQTILDVDAPGAGGIVAKAGYMDSTQTTNLNVELIQFPTEAAAKARLSSVESALKTCQHTTATLHGMTIPLTFLTQVSATQFGDGSVVIGMQASIQGQPDATGATVARKGATLVFVSVELQETSPRAPKDTLVQAALDKYTKAAS